MPKTDRNNANGAIALSWFLLNRNTGNVTPVPSSLSPLPYHDWVPVLTTDWVSDAVGYEDAGTLGATWYYADVPHNLGSSTAMAEGYILPSTGRRYKDIKEQIPCATNPLNLLRVYLSYLPSEDVLFCVLR